MIATQPAHSKRRIIPAGFIEALSERLWTARHNAYFAGLQLRPGCRASTTDVCVPISRLAECVTETAVEQDQASFPYTIVGHMDDGNFHVLMIALKQAFDPHNILNPGKIIPREPIATHAA